MRSKTFLQRQGIFSLGQTSPSRRLRRKPQAASRKPQAASRKPQGIV
jgi:hypothetical protein